MYINQSFISQTKETADAFNSIYFLNHNSIDPVKLLGFSWISYAPQTQDKPTTFIFREEKQELLVVKEGVVKKGHWETLFLSNSMLINDGVQELLFNIVYFGNVAMILKKENLDEYLVLIKRSKANLQDKPLTIVLQAMNEDYLKIQKQFDNINLETTDAALEFEDIAEFREYRLFPYVATLGTILIIIAILVILISNFWR